MLEERFPGISLDRSSLHGNISVHGDNATIKDIVAFANLEGEVQVGELLLTVGIASTSLATAGDLFSFISLWPYLVPRPSADASCIHLHVQDNPIKIPTENIEALLTYTLSDDKTSCLALAPFEMSSS